MTIDRDDLSAASGRRADGHRMSSGGRRVWRDVAVLTAGQGATQLLNLAALAVVARTLGPEDFGLVQVAVAAAAYVMVAAEAGLFTVGVRDLARIDDPQQRRRLVDSRSGLLLVLAAAALVLFLPLTRLLPFCSADPILFALYLAAVAPQAFMLDWAALALGAPAGASAARTMRAVAYTLLVATVWSAWGDALGQPSRRWLAVAYLVSLTSGNLVAWLVVRGRLGRGPRPSFAGIRPWRVDLGAAAPVGAANIVRRVLYGVDILLLGALASTSAAGCYAAAAKLGFVLVVGVEVALGTLLPRLSRAWACGPADFAAVLRRQSVALVAVLAAAGAAGALLGPTVLALVFGEDFGASSDVLPLLMIAYPMLGLGLYLHEAQIAAHRQRGALAPLIAAAVTAVTAGVLMIPGGGAMGAARMMILAHGVYAVGGLVRCRGLWRPR